jgi:hypothetical protein
MPSVAFVRGNPAVLSIGFCTKFDFGKCQSIPYGSRKKEYKLVKSK